MPIFNTYIGDDSETPASTKASESDDQRLRSNIQWGVVRGMFLYSVLMLPIVFIAGLIIWATK